MHANIISLHYSGYFSNALFEVIMAYHTFTDISLYWNYKLSVLITVSQCNQQKKTKSKKFVNVDNIWTLGDKYQSTFAKVIYQRAKMGQDRAFTKLNIFHD